MKQLLLTFVIIFLLGTAIAKADSDLPYVPELRYTCSPLHFGLDLHLTKYADASGVKDSWVGDVVPWEETFSIDAGVTLQNYIL